MNKYDYTLGKKCSVCAKPVKNKNTSGYCRTHFGLKLRHTEPSYDVLHNWLNYHYKKTGLCSFCKLEKRTVWALIQGKKYERTIDNFIELCYGCHRVYDNTDAWRAKARLSLVKATKAIPNIVFYKYKGKKLTTPQLAKIAGMSYQSLRERLKRGMSLKQAMTLPKQSRQRIDEALTPPQPNPSEDLVV